MNNLHHVVIVGAGFGGIQTAHHLKKANVRITLIDQHNYHLFQPLLYQAATALLAPSEIAWPIRHLLRKRTEITTLLAKVINIDKTNKKVVLENNESIEYDTLVLATGARHAYFGHDEWANHAPGLKVLEDATDIRQKILIAFEKAEREADPEHRAALLSFVVVGGGPTGVELAGTIAELAHHTLSGEFRNIDIQKTRVILIEGASRVLPNFEESLSAYAMKALENLGVEVVLGKFVSECSAKGVVFDDKEIASKTILWAAGVQASPAADWLEAETDQVNRVKIDPDLTLPDHPEVFVIGDTATINDENGKQVPGIAPAAKQQGQYVAKLISARLKGKSNIKPFRYRHYGDLATIGKRAAVFDIGWMKARGRLAWWLWGLAHIYFLIGVRNRIVVAMHWLWIYFKGDRGARLITQVDSISTKQKDH
ncbi:MAG: NAD(P)/FAD-dependent oxidoreductase [Gammaproteobacteria bacterium]